MPALSPNENGKAAQRLTIDEAVAQACDAWNVGQYAQAEHLCSQILQKVPQHSAALHLMGLLAYTHGNRPLALGYLRQACASPSAPASFHSNLAEFCRQSGHLAEAEAAARRAIAIDASYVSAWNNLGIILQESGKLEESLIWLNRVAARTPNHESENNLANTLMRLGRLEEARGHYLTALAMRPSYAEAHNNLSVLWECLGDYKRAIEEARRAVDLNPRYADAYANAARFLLRSGEPQEALRWLDKLATIVPDHPGGLITRARALIECDRREEALQAVQRAAAVAPENGEVADAIGQVFTALERPDEALAAFERAFHLPAPHAESALISKGILLKKMGRPSEALACFDEAVKVNPNSAGAWFDWSATRKFFADDPAIPRMETLLATGVVEGMDGVTALHYALGKAWLEAGNGDRAFSHFTEGARLKRASFDYDPDATAQVFTKIIETFTPELVTALSGLGDIREAPVFVLGMPRSGTTLIEQILASHPRVHGAGELRTVRRLVEGAGADYPYFIPKLDPQALLALGKYYVDHVTKYAPVKDRIIDKMPGNFLYAGLIHLMLPNARIIHSVRDPVDTCMSCYTTLFAGELKYTYDLAELARFYRGYEEVMAHWRRLLPAERFLEVRYEDVVGDLEGQARRMVAFLGLEWNDACLSFHKTNRIIHTASLDQVRQPIYRTSIGRWKAHAHHFGRLLDVLDQARSRAA